MQETTIASFDGRKISVFHSDLVPSKPYVTVVLPFGLRPTAGAELFARLSTEFNVLTWQSRCIIDRAASSTEAIALTPQMHAGDMVQMLRHFGVRTGAVVGFCSGAGIALLAASEHGRMFDRLVLVCGEYMLPSAVCPQTNFQREVDSLLPLAASSRKVAASLCEKLVMGKGKAETEFDGDVSLPFSDPEYLHRHGINYLSYRKTDFRSIATSIPHPVLLISTQDDRQVTAQSSRIIADLMANKRGHVTVPGDHYEILRGRAGIVALLSDFLSREVA